MGVLAGLLILGYYSVVAGWTLEYIVASATNSFAGKGPDDFVASFQEFSQDPFRPLLWLLAFLFFTHYIVVKGVKDGIEKSAKIMMPVLFILIVVLAICSITLPNADKGLEFLLKPDFSKVNADVFLGAMGQAFFSLSLGMGCLSTYASYFGSDTRLGKTALSVGVIDTMIAILAGLIIFPAAFSVGIQPDAGPSLIFITLPNVFQQAFGGVDDLNIPFGTLRLRKNGSAGGHNGLTNINELIGTQEYARIRVGIGNDFGRGQQVGYVLGELSAEEKAEMPEVCKRCIDGVKAWATVGPDRAMNVVNTRPKPKQNDTEK